jgi:SAM-dependent MidA family methyltransferase
MPPALRLRDRIRSEGPIPFAAFMEEALYGEEGYYSRDAVPIGEEGDYVTGSSLSPLFGRGTARLLSRLDRALGRPAERFEPGYGMGTHLESVVSSPGDPRRVRAWDRVARTVPAGVERVSTFAEVGEIDGLIFSYELFDALPVHRLIGRADGSVGELWVDVEGDGFVWREGGVSDPSLPDLLGGAVLAPGQVADLAPGWGPLYREIAGRLRRGLVVTCDYGFERERLLDIRVRQHGTLACYSRQRVHRNPFVLVGGQDLTAHVDFTALLRAGEEAGLTTFAFTRQAFWLTACGLFEELEGADFETRRQAMALLDGEGMGEEIRVLVQGRGIDPGEVLGPGLELPRA